MPEGPEVRKIADTIEDVVGHRLVTLAVKGDPKYKFCRDGIVGHDLLQNHPSYLVEKVVVKGKLIRIDLEHGISIINTLGMSGTWKKGMQHKHARAYLIFGSEEGKPDLSNALTFCDQRSFGNLKVVKRSEAISATKAIGWDLLQGPMSVKKWRELQKKKYFKDKEIGPALMEQKDFAGIGNIYKAEILHELGINPTIKVKDIDPKIWDRVNLTAHKILSNSYNMGGSSVRSYSAGGRKGTYQKVLRVYNQKKCPAGHDVEKLKQKSRTTWYCPTCQK